MDAARCARRLAPAGRVTIVYRRTRAEMPADPEEIAACLAEGIELLPLRSPVRLEVASGRVVALVCERMGLGEPDASGRPRPVPTGIEERLAADTLVVAIGQEPILDFAAEALRRGPGGTLAAAPRSLETSVPGVFAIGDVTRGPSSIIRAVADGQTVAFEIASRMGRQGTEAPGPAPGEPPDLAALMARRGRREPPRLGPELATAEADRCLQCDTVCNLCVTVCPNRALHAYEVAPVELPSLMADGDRLVEEAAPGGSIRQAVQILKLADFCNECGNCTSFCPTAGQPWRQKPGFWLDRAGFEAARGDAFSLLREGGRLTIEARIEGRRHRLRQTADAVVYDNDRVEVRLTPSGRRIVSARPVVPLARGERIELQDCAKLVALLSAAPLVP
jgi:putative selenate reductase